MDNHTAGVDLDSLETYPSPHGTLVRLADVKCVLARRAEPRVTEQASEREGFDPMERDDWRKLSELRAVLEVKAEVPFTVFQFAILRIKRLYAERDEARAALTQQAAPEAPTLRPLSAGLPLPEDHDSVLVYTEGVDFNGDQYFHINTEDLWEPDPDMRTEVADAATHWMPLPRPDAAPAPAAQQAGADYSDPTLACSSCGLTMGESRTLGHIKLGILSTSAATTASASIANHPEIPESSGCAPAPSQDSNLLGPQRWSKEPEMMESWLATAPSRDAADAFSAAVDAEYPLPDNPHASVIQRATDNRAAMWRGINAARSILAQHDPEDEARYAKLVSQVHYWMDRGDRATTALDSAEAEIADLRAALAKQGASQYAPMTYDEFFAEAKARGCKLPDNLSEILASHASNAGEYTAAARDVLAERRRQVGAEGWTVAHDDTHCNGEMAQAAACYAIKSAGLSAPAKFWPWSVHWFKGSDPRRCLVKAGALILADIERIDRTAIAASTKEKK
jgi:hypothetical protein